MAKSTKENYQPESLVAHELVNNLAALIGRCDLLLADTPEDSPLRKHAVAIRNIARSMVEELNRLQEELAQVRQHAKRDSVA